MSTAIPIERTNSQPVPNQTTNEIRDEKIARYGSPEFTQELTEAFHRAKRLGIQADREAAKQTTQPAEGQPKP